MKRNTKIAIAAGGGLLGLVALYLYYTSQSQGGQEQGGGGGGGGGGPTISPSGPPLTGGPTPNSLADLINLVTKGGAGYTSNAVGGAGVIIPVPTTLSPLSKAGMAAELQGNPTYAPGYLQAVSSNDWMATSLSSPGSPGAGVIMSVSPDVVASAGLKKSLLFTNAAGDIGAKVTGVTSQGIVQTTAGDFYAPSPTNPSLSKKVGTAFKCTHNGVEVPCATACHNAQGIQIPC